jgi:general secretion pathway protein E
MAGQDFGFHDDKRPAPPHGMVYQATGCPSCMGTGYSGRTGIYELLMMDDEIRALVLKNTDANSIKKAAVAKGMYTLRMDGMRKIISGWTTIEEVMRVTQEDTN